jgi:tetratricopeptide (TPR) repeat protein
MLKQVPIQVWLLVAIAVTAYVPARYVFRFLRQSPSRRDITKPADNLDWRTPGKLSFNLVAFAVLAMLAVFIFTPAAAKFAQAPIFWPILLLAFSVWALVAVGRGFLVGRIQPIIRGYSPTFERGAQPKRYWASMCWNAVLGSLFLGGSVMGIWQAPAQALEDRCYDYKTAHTAQEDLSACNELISDRSKSHDDLSGAMNARGSAFYRLGDYRHAHADYTEAARLDPKDSASRYNLGLADEQLGSRERAVADYTASIKASADNADAYMNRGLIYLDTGKFDQAVADFSQVHQRRPDDAMALADRGIAYAWKHDRPRAEQDFAAVRKIDPGNVVLAHGEAVLSMNAGNFKGAIDQLTAILKLYPTDTFSLGLRALAYRQLEEPNKMQADIAAMKRAGAR